jgi:ribonuclease HI
MTNIHDFPASLGRHYLIATDGACLGNPGRGGWGAVQQLRDGDLVMRQMPRAGHHRDTTNNRMELMAVIQPMTRQQEPGLPVLVLSDSEYLVKGMTQWLPKWKANGWKSAGGPVKNRDLWETLDELAQLRPVTWTWVRGHDGHRLNEMADTLASNAARDLYRRKGVSCCDMHPEWVL